jgi:hypothetical protein
LKGAAKSVAARRLAAVLETVERAARAGDRLAALTSASTLIHEVSQLATLLSGQKEPHGE